jgi:cbb3-type cytochrome oxidase subunit 3
LGFAFCTLAFDLFFLCVLPFDLFFLASKSESKGKAQKANGKTKQGLTALPAQPLAP